MGKRGRQPVPKELKLVTGQRVRPHEKQSASLSDFGFPEKPENVLEDERMSEIWDKIKERCEVAAYVGAVDCDDLEMLCYCIATYREAREEMEDKGKVLDDGKRLYENPWVKIAKDHLDRAHRICSNFGFNPSSRNNIIIPEKKTDEGESFDAFINRA